MQTVVLMNRAAGRGRSRAKLALVGKLCVEAGAEVIETASGAEAEQRARRAAEGGCARIIAGGGDGTVHYVLNGVARTAAALGIIPLGSGNDLARSLGLPLEALDAARLALAGGTRALDMASVGMAGNAGRYFIGVASLGLASHANRIANRHQRLGGTAMYVYAMLRALVEFSPPSVRIESDGGRFDGRLLLAAIANGPSFGGGMRIAPRATMADGLLDLCVVREMSRLKLLCRFPGVFRGLHLRHPEVAYFQATRVRVEADRPLDIFADGEPAGQTPVDVELFPGALTVVAP